MALAPVPVEYYEGTFCVFFCGGSQGLQTQFALIMNIFPINVFVCWAPFCKKSIINSSKWRNPAAVLMHSACARLVHAMLVGLGVSPSLSFHFGLLQ